MNRTNKCPLATEKSLKKEEKIFDYRNDDGNKVFAVVWKDNNDVKTSHLVIRGQK